MPLKLFNGPIIQAGQFQSDVLAIQDYYIVGLATPDDWSPGLVSVIVSPDGDNYFDLFDGAGREFVFNITGPGSMIYVDPHRLLSAAFVRLRSGTRDHPVTQEETRRFFMVGTSKLA